MIQSLIKLLLLVRAYISRSLVHFDWNIEIIVQFYATSLKRQKNVREMHWMTEGEWCHITFNEFATWFSYGQVDKDRFSTHIHNPLDENEMKFMYPPGQ
jgi:hypothetical protein